jgi:hypothetical protein
MGRDRIFWLDLLERTATTFVQGLVIGAFIVAGVQDGNLAVIALPDFDDLFSLATLKAGIVGGVLALGKGFLAGQFVGDPNSAALLPSPPDHA